MKQSVFYKWLLIVISSHICRFLKTNRSFKPSLGRVTRNQRRLHRGPNDAHSLLAQHEQVPLPLREPLYSLDKAHYRQMRVAGPTKKHVPHRGNDAHHSFYRYGIRPQLARHRELALAYSATLLKIKSR